MKAAVLTSVVALVFAVNVNAKNVKTYSNVTNEESGVKKEYTTFKNDNSQPLSKVSYQYDNDGCIQEKVVSKWNNEKGWVDSEKYSYKYNESGQVETLAYTKWDTKKNTWSNKSDVLLYGYNTNNEFSSIDQIEVKKEAEYKYISQK